MRAAGRQTGGSHEDMLLSRLYQQVTELQEPLFGTEYDLGKGLERYRIWLREHTEGSADSDALPATVTGTLMAPGAVLPDAGLTSSLTSGLTSGLTSDLTSGLTSDLTSDLTSGTAHVEWSADRAVTELYSRHYRSLVRLAAMLVRDTPTAEEVVQDSFVAMHDGWQRLRDAEKALAYLRQAVVNRSRSVLRHRMVVDKNLQKAPPDMPSAEHGAFILLERSALVAALRDLPGRQREAIVLRYYADLSEAEIAIAMGISRGAVKSHTARGISSLRAALEQE